MAQFSLPDELRAPLSFRHNKQVSLRPGIDFFFVPVEFLVGDNRQGHIPTMVDDDDMWLTQKWWMLRDALLPILREHSVDIVAEVIATGRIGDANWDAFMKALLKDLQARVGALTGLFDAALDLFADAAPLRKTIEEGGAKLDPETHTNLDPKVREKMARGVLGTALKRGIARMRDIRIGGTAYKGKLWARLDQISRAIAKDRFQTTGNKIDRCSMDHFIDVLAYVGEHHPTDHNIARTLRTIEEYFEEYCIECEPVATDIDAMIENPADMMRMLPDSEYVAVDLMHCFDELERKEKQTALFVKVHVGISDPPEKSVSAFCERMAIERRRFGRIVKRGLEQLKQCLEGRNATRFGSPDLGFRSSWQDL